MLVFGAAMVAIMICRPRGLFRAARRRSRPGRRAKPKAIVAARSSRRGTTAAVTTAARVARAPLLAVEHLTMRFGGLLAVSDLSFTAARRARSPP